MPWERGGSRRMRAGWELVEPARRLLASVMPGFRWNHTASSLVLFGCTAGALGTQSMQAAGVRSTVLISSCLVATSAPPPTPLSSSARTRVPLLDADLLWPRACTQEHSSSGGAAVGQLGSAQQLSRHESSSAGTPLLLSHSAWLQSCPPARLSALPPSSSGPQSCHPRCT